MSISSDRRQFLRFLAGSPLFTPAFAQPAANPKVDEILNVLELEEMARKALPSAHWGYMASGVDDDLTIRANREGFRRIQIRPKRLVDVSMIDTRTEVFGTTWAWPLFLSPVGGTKAFYRDGELAVARAAKARNMTQILSTQSSYSVEDVAKAKGSAPWYQLYMPADWIDFGKCL